MTCSAVRALYVVESTCNLPGKSSVLLQMQRFFQPTTQPTKRDVLYDLRGVWQSPRACKLL
jgi:hypothetical protein